MNKIAELIEKYDIQITDGNLATPRMDQIKRDGMLETIKANLADIKSYILDQQAAIKKAAEDKANKIKAIEGLDKINECRDAWAAYQHDFSKMMETGCGYMTAKKPETKVEDLRAEYPRADAYLKAEAEASRSNYELAAIGKKAMERIISGEDHETVISDMDADIKAFASKHLWD